MTETRISTLDPEIARRFFEGKIVRIFDSDRLWTRCANTEFLRDIGAFRFNHNSQPQPGARFLVIGLKLYEPSGRLYACLEDTSTPQHFLCNIAGVEIDVNSKLSKENTMNTTITSSTTIIETRTFVFGNDINNMTPDQLIGAIQAVEKAIADMKATTTNSEYITNRIKSMTEDLAKIAAVLDAK